MIFPIPDGFEILSTARLNSYQSIGGAPQWGIRNQDRHIIIVVSSRKAGLLSRLVSESVVVSKMELNIAKAMSPYGYELLEYSDLSLGKGFTYTYTVEDIRMQATSLIIRKDKSYWYIHAYYQQANADGDLQLLNDILKNITWKKTSL